LLRPGVFAIIYFNSRTRNYHLTIRDVANSKTLFLDNKAFNIQPFSYKGNEVRFLLVLKPKELYCLDLGTIEKATIDTLTDEDDKFTNMCTYVEDEKAHIVVTVN
jgi:hypothetical protein